MNTETNPASRAVSHALALLVSGLGIGWLTGLSLTPVVGTVLTSILGIVGGAVAGFTALDAERLKIHSPWPVALLIVGIAVGGPLGILARTHDLFGAPFAESRKTAEMERAAIGVLYATGGKSCARLLGTPDQYLVSALRTSPLPWAPRLAEALADDPEALRQVVEVLCQD
jgi:hypothetical protein